MQIEALSLPGVKLITPHVFSDERGFFLETWQANRYKEAGLPEFVQDNHSHSEQGTLRGLHFTVKKPQAQLVYVTSGEILDVVVDLRNGSPSFGQWSASILSDDNHKQIFIPAGFAHGFLVIRGNADVHYKVTEFYDQDDEGGLNWADPDVAIDWQQEMPRISPRDTEFPLLGNLTAERLPHVFFENTG